MSRLSSRGRSTQALVHTPHVDLCVWSYLRPSYIFQVSSKSVQGSWSHGGRNFAISITLTIDGSRDKMTFQCGACYKRPRLSGIKKCSPVMFTFSKSCISFLLKNEALAVSWLGRNCTLKIFQVKANDEGEC